MVSASAKLSNPRKHDIALSVQFPPHNQILLSYSNMQEPYFPGLIYKSFFKISHPASVLAVACLQHTVRGTHPSIWKATPCLAFNMYSWCETASRNTDRGRNKQSVYSLPDTAAAVYFFFDTPTVFPLWPVVLVCCPLTWGEKISRRESNNRIQR